MDKEIICPNCGSRMICYEVYYVDNQSLYLAYCPNCKLGNKSIPGKSEYTELKPDKIDRIKSTNGIKSFTNINFQCNECGNFINYQLVTLYNRDKYLLGYCNKCGNIDLRSINTLKLKFSFPYDTKEEIIKSSSSSKTDNSNKIEEFKKDVINIVDEVISEDFCTIFCIGDRDKYCDEINCARNKIINKLKLKLKVNGKLKQRRISSPK